MMKMQGSFRVATRETGVNGAVMFSDNEVYLKLSDTAAFDEDLAWCELVDVAEAVHGANTEIGNEQAEKILAKHVRKGDKFLTDGMAEALSITDMRSGAFAVQMDDPVDLWIAMDRYCRDRVKPALGFNYAQGINFIEGAGNMWDCLAQPSIIAGLWNAFAVKWNLMVARPQEVVAAAISDPSVAPALFLKAIEPFVDFDMVSSDPRTFTIYPEGCPPHPSYVAGHGTFAGVVYALLCLKYGLHNQSALHNEVGQTLLSFAHCRSIAGVHYFQDNSRGFELGVRSVKQGITGLAVNMGVDDQFIGEVEAACERLDGTWCF